jgi:signal transduction histidine kinase
VASPLAVPAGVAHTLRRVAREATTDVVKHARARLVTCRLDATPAWSLRVEDDGRGFAGATNGGQGLGIMRRRVERAGGTIDYGNAPSGGAFVVATMARDV